mmetsp:Transcript_87924/g.257070  ORF Transcript_87924/g.257070 Transcript_87924/m.257070 type:complete len:81 (+) Transcript_87924:293-535(+)
MLTLRAPIAVTPTMTLKWAIPLCIRGSFELGQKIGMLSVLILGFGRPALVPARKPSFPIDVQRLPCASDSPRLPPFPHKG